MKGVFVISICDTGVDIYSGKGKIIIESSHLK